LKEKVYFVVLVHLRVCCSELVVTVHVMLSLETGGSAVMISNETLKLSILLTDRELMPCTETTCGGTRAGLGVGDTANITEEEGVTIGVSNTEVEAVSRTKLDTKDEAISESDGVT
jgi:hypothetical protein